MSKPGIYIDADTLVAIDPVTGTRVEVSIEEAARRILTGPDLLMAARVFADHYERSICTHEETVRGGAIWTICQGCGTKWADDKGGFKPFEYPDSIVNALAALAAYKGEKS